MTDLGDLPRSTSLSDVEAYLGSMEKPPSKADYIAAGNQTPDEMARLTEKIAQLVERWALIKVRIPDGLTGEEFEAIIAQAFDEFTSNASDDEGGPEWQVAATLDVIEVEGEVDSDDTSVTFFKPGDVPPALEWRHPRLQSAGGDNRIVRFHYDGRELFELDSHADDTTISFELTDAEGTGR